MTYPEFEQYQQVIDPHNPFCPKFLIDAEHDFYLEPVFYTMLNGFKDHHADKYQCIVDKMIEIVKKNKHVVFVGNFEYPQTEVEGYIYLEITDVTDRLQIYVEDKSRGSDYGD